MAVKLTSGPPRPPTTVREQADVDRFRRTASYVVIITASLIFGGMAYTADDPGRALAFLVLAVTSVASFAHPFIGVYVIMFVTLVGDASTMPSWPYTKNLSSRESIMFVSDAIVINPIEILLVAAFVSFLLQRLEDPTWRFQRASLFTPIVVVLGFVTFGMLNGSLNGGDRRTAIFESRGLFYIPIIYILVTNLLTTRQHYERLLKVSLVGICIQSVFALDYYRGLTEVEKEALRGLGQHSATILMNMMFVFLLGLILLRGRRRTMLAVLAMTPPVVYAYILAQRRAAMISLIVGIFLLAATLWLRRRRAFWFFTPTVLILGAGLVAATWNATGTAGLLSGSIKSVIAPEDLSEQDRSSSLYRDVENFDLWYTIQQYKVLGRGFGQVFLKPAALPDITWVEFWEYIPHNSILYIWVKLGFFGFVAVLFLFFRCIQLGARGIVTVRTRHQVCYVLAGLSFVTMFLVFAYVDIAWDLRSCIFFGFALTLSADYAGLPERKPRSERIEGRPALAAT